MPPDPWGEDNRSSAFGTFPGLCPICCFFPWLILICSKLTVSISFGWGLWIFSVNYQTWGWFWKLPHSQLVSKVRAILCGGLNFFVCNATYISFRPIQKEFVQISSEEGTQNNKRDTVRNWDEVWGEISNFPNPLTAEIASLAVQCNHPVQCKV